MVAQRSGSGGSMRLFDSPMLESLSRAHPASPALAFVPLALGLLIWAALTQAPWQVAVGFVAGVAVWTLAEYMLHRFVYHFEARSDWARRLIFVLHGVHHAEPGDATRCVLPLAVSVPIAAGLWLALQWLLGSWFASVGAGLAIAYAAYESLHFAIHHWPMRQGWAARLKQHHLRHHFIEQDRSNYGVTATVWDQVLGTAGGKASRRPGE